MTAKHGPGNLIEKRTSFFIVILSLIGFFVFLFKTKYGIGVNPDSVLYLDTARNLSHGLGIVYLSKQGMLLPATHFLPLYPILLSSFNFWGIAPLESARWLNAFLFSANISLVGYLIYKYTHSIGISRAIAVSCLSDKTKATILICICRDYCPEFCDQIRRNTRNCHRHYRFNFIIFSRSANSH